MISWDAMFLMAPLLPESGSYLKVKRFARLTTDSRCMINYLIITLLRVYCNSWLGDPQYSLIPFLSQESINGILAFELIINTRRDRLE
jgi:hypothetical protein